jgi:hypothetical protein
VRFELDCAARTRGAAGVLGATPVAVQRQRPASVIRGAFCWVPLALLLTIEPVEVSQAGDL